MVRPKIIWTGQQALSFASSQRVSHVHQNNAHAWQNSTQGRYQVPVTPSLQWIKKSQDYTPVRVTLRVTKHMGQRSNTFSIVHNNTYTDNILQTTFAVLVNDAVQLMRLYSVGDRWINEHGTTVGWQWYAKTLVLKKPASVQFCPPQIPQLAWDWTL